METRMKRLAILLAAATVTATPVVAQNVNVPENIGSTPNAYNFDGPYAYAPGGYAYAPDGYAYAPRQRYVYDPNNSGYWYNGRYWQCSQSYTPNRPDRSAGGSNVTEQCY
jgi:hypothetical protein